ncbi:MAG: SPOR domain-containing protein [Hyphomicrobiaceae bacterium]
MLPKGAAPHPRSSQAAHDPSAPAHGHASAYPQQYDPQQYETGENRGRSPMPGGSPSDIFSALRPDASLASRFEPFQPPAGRPESQGAGFGRPQFGEPESQPYAAPGHDPYTRPLPGGYPAHGGYGSEAGAEHDAHYYGQQPQHSYAPQGGYGHCDAYAYDDPYRPNARDPYQQAGAGYGPDGGYYDDEYVDEAEIPERRGPRAIVVVGALLGAIALGGGLAYGYKTLTGGGRDGGKLPILRADSAPAKAQPTEPGGKQVAHTDKKFLNRLAEDSGPVRPVPVSIQPPAPEREAGDGPRRVPTLVVNRDGSIAPSGGAASVPPPAPPSSGVPGLLVDGLTPRLPPPQRQAPPPPPQTAARVAPVEEATPAAPPRRVAAAPPAASVEPPQAALPAPRAEAEPKRPAPTRQAARTPPPAPAPAAPGPAAATTSGYVAVIASRQTHMDALKSLADIQQKHPSALLGRAADVRQANLGEKGIWYRVVVGPPGSREAANAVCGQLKSQGFSGCWIMPY